MNQCREISKKNSKGKGTQELLNNLIDLIEMREKEASVIL